MMKKILPIAFKAGAVLVIIICTIVLVRALDARRQADLELWHRTELTREFTRAQYEEPITLDQYLEVEEKLFRELDEKVIRNVSPETSLQLNRYFPGGINNPLRFHRNWNRTYQKKPDRIRGGALLLHGLTDSPYSLRRCGELLYQQGYYVLGLRLPGHGTIPGALQHITWEDWMAAVRTGVRHVAQVIGPDKPFLLLGYSNGGALAVKYSLDALENSQLSQPDHVVLFSPAIGITRLAIFSRFHHLLSFIPYFEKYKWLSIEPEYDPYKYNSFPKNGGTQSYRLSRAIQRQVSRLHQKGEISRFPPVLTFQSLVDSTVLTEAISERFYGKLNNNGSELVLFDINRLDRLRPFIGREPRKILNLLENSTDLPYHFTLITNADSRTQMVIAKTRPAGETQFIASETGLAWPSEVYSLSHVAIPFSPDDPLYGGQLTRDTEYGLPLGRLSPRGERDLLSVSVNQLMRLRYNPFFDYVENRLKETAVSTLSLP